MKTLNKKIVIEPRRERGFILAEPFDVYTSRLNRLNKKYNLKPNERIAFRIPKNFVSDGASTHEAYNILIWIWVGLIAVSSFLSFSPIFYTILGLATLLTAMNLNPLNKWILPASIIHDWLWGEGYINAYVYDRKTNSIVKKLGIEKITDKEGNQVMDEKMSAFYAPVFWQKLIIITLEAVRKLK